MREIVGSKNTIGQMASVLKKLQKATFTFYTYTYSFVVSARVRNVEGMANADEGQGRNKNASEWIKVRSISVQV